MNLKHVNRLLESVLVELDERSTSPQDWEEADKVLTRGFGGSQFSGLGGVKKAYEELASALSDAQKSNEGMKRRGVGTTEAPTLLYGLVDNLEELARLASATAKSLERFR